jgi:hypothetical protein
MADTNILNTPLIWINKYLQAKVSDAADLDMIPFFPTAPTAIDDLTESFPEGALCVYDRLSRMNKSKFPHIKTEQVLYYFYATAADSVVTMIKIQEAVLRLMDRLDETAEEVNNWCSIRKVNLGTADNPDFINNMFYFHRFRVYQLEEARDIIDFGTARTYGGNKFIIEFDYHQMPGINTHTWTPEGLPVGGKITI